MPEKHDKMISIWVFVGLLLLIYGALVMGEGMWELFAPPAHPVVLAELRAGLWWGALMLVVGAIFVGANSRW